MTSSHLNSSRTPRRRGFTLVELMVAITVIGILVGMLAAGIFPVLRTARETTINLEMKQIELSIEQFKTQYGFYPPSFESGTNINGTAVGVSSAADLMRYVNRMSPNHSEGAPSGHGTESRLEHWYEEIGQFLDQESSLVFWLSGVCKNKQFPITGGVDTSLAGPPLAAHNFGVGDTIERDVFYDFKVLQLHGNETGEVVSDGFTAIPGALSGFIYEYNQGHGPSVGNLLFKYRDAASYDLGGTTTPALPAVANTAYCNGGVQGTVAPFFYNFANPDTFQLVTFGMDGQSGAPGNIFRANGGSFTVAGVPVKGYDGADNLCNFAEGRLDKFLNSISD